MEVGLVKLILCLNRSWIDENNVSVNRSWIDERNFLLQ